MRDLGPITVRKDPDGSLHLRAGLRGEPPAIKCLDDGLVNAHINEAREPVFMRWPDVHKMDGPFEKLVEALAGREAPGPDEIFFARRLLTLAEYRELEEICEERAAQLVADWLEGGGG